MIGDNSLSRPIITGFNWHPEPLETQDQSIISLSNIHSNPQYLDRAEEDISNLNLRENAYELKTRDKTGMYRWKIDFVFRDNNGDLEQCVKIRDQETGEYIDLESIPQKSLLEAGFSPESIRIGENSGYEINIYIQGNENLKKISAEFLKKIWFETI